MTTVEIDPPLMRSLARDILQNEPSFKLAGIENYDANYWHLIARSLAEMVVALTDEQNTGTERDS